MRNVKNTRFPIWKTQRKKACMCALPSTQGGSCIKDKTHSKSLILRVERKNADPLHITPTNDRRASSM